MKLGQEPAFPGTFHNGSSDSAAGPDGEVLPPGHTCAFTGMTLRDYFAAQAMQAMLPIYNANPSFDLAACAYITADSMLKARAA